MGAATLFVHNLFRGFKNTLDGSLHCALYLID